MKLITAIIQPHKLTDVKQSLFDNGIHKMTVSNVLGAGAQSGYIENYRGVKEEINLLKKIKVEIIVSDNFLDRTIDAIVSSANTDTIGDGKIYVQDLVDCIRIRTGEKGNKAIG